MNFKRYITRDPAICGGKAAVTGTRITVRTSLASLAEGMSAEQILADFLTLTPHGTHAVIASAAMLDGRAHGTHTFARTGNQPR